MKPRNLSAFEGTDGADMIDLSAWATPVLVTARGGADTVTGGQAGDDLRGNNGSDNIDGGAGNDTLYGGAPNDLDRDQDAAHGPDGNDTLKGGSGNDLLAGGQGEDVLVGGAGADTLYGGAGGDTFVFIAADTGGDVIADFEPGLDLIDLTRTGATSWSATLSAGNTILTAGDLTVTLTGAVDLTAGDVLL